MDPAKIQLVQQSLGRCLLARVDETSFLDAFYEEFLASDPRIRPLFARTDMEKQKHLLKHGLATLVLYSGGSGLAKTSLGQLAQKHDHDHLNIEPGMYRLWVRSLLACVKKYDRKYDATLGKAWEEVLEPGISAMSQAY